MEFTRRFWTVAAVGAFLAGYGALLETAIPLLGAAGIGGWLLARQWAFRRDLARVAATLTVEQSFDRSRVAVDERTVYSIATTRSDETTLTVDVSGAPPVAATEVDDAQLTHTLDPAQWEATGSTMVTWPVAGSFECDPPSVTATDAHGLFAETIQRGSTPEIQVEARSPNAIHVGAGGDPFASTYGEHPGGQLTTGIDPAELREYLPGDAARLIDWKATARQQDAYVREYEGQSDQRTVLVLDHSTTLADGPAGQRKFDFLREVALGFLENARELSDPFGCYTVGDEGITGQFDPGATEQHFTRIRRHLADLAPTDRERPPRPVSLRAAGPAAARQAAQTLDHDPTAFGATLRPYFQASRTYVDRIAGDPLFEAIETYVGDVRGTVRTVVLTDDRDHGQLREIAKFARRGNDHVVVFVTPSVLFEPGGLVDLEAAYQEYLEFEEFRRELAGLPRVTAFEVAPGDRLDALLTAHRRERRRAGGGDYGTSRS